MRGFSALSSFAQICATDCSRLVSSDKILAGFRTPLGGSHSKSTMSWQVNQALFADLPLVGRHDRRVSLGNMLRWIQDRLAQICVVSNNRLAVREHQL